MAEGEREVRQLMVIKKPKPDTATVIELDMDEPWFKGDGPLDFVCGGCRKPLLVGMEPGQIGQVVLLCTCGAHNQTMD